MGWGGNIGPNLDNAKPNYTLVLDRVTNGKAPMPSFKGELTEAQIKCIATVVVDADRAAASTPADAGTSACKDLA